MKWKTKQIKELGKVITGKTPSINNPDHFGNEYPFITPSDIPAFNKYVDVERYLSDKGSDLHKNILLPPKSVCVVCIGATIGKVCMTNMPSFSNQQINSIIPFKSESDPDFIYYLTLMLKDTLINYAGGAATPIINKSTFSSIKVLIPELKEQQQIGAILSAYDDLIETNNQWIATLEQLAQQIYKEWFVRMRFPGWENTPLYHGIPEGWEQIPFGDIAKEVRRHVKLKDLKPDSIYVGLEHLPTKSIALQDWDIAESINSDKLLFHRAEILFCKIRPYLHKVALAPVNGSCSSDTIVIKATEKRFLPYALQIVFCDTFIDYATVTSKGTKMPRADWGVLKKFPIFKPSGQLLEKFNQISLPMLEQINLLSEMNRSLSKTRNLLLPRLISGKLTLKQASSSL
jgi:type I restriction enzyme, S subunit